jgi:hypothetical protein
LLLWFLPELVEKGERLGIGEEMGQLSLEVFHLLEVFMDVELDG